MQHRISTRLLVLLASAATPVIAFAQEHGGEEAVGALPTSKQGIASALTALLVFAVVFAILGVKVWPVIVRALDERASKIRSEIDAAEAARKQAKDALEKYEKSLADARAEAQKMLERTKAEQQALADELRAKADADLTAMRERAKRDIEIAKRAALTDIANQAAAIATAIAAKLLQREVNSRDQERLIAESMNEVATAQS